MPIRRSPSTARIDRIAPAVRIDDKVRVFDVEIRLDAQGRELRSGMTANIEVHGERKTKVLTVPVESVFKRDEQRDRLREEDHRPEGLRRRSEEGRRTTTTRKTTRTPGSSSSSKRVVVTGLADNANVEILSGLKPGEEVALEDPTLPNDKKKDDNDD